jgi:prepilin-type N-terminal cleavage/methylation domain-containing protein/prepilin-type processing-associated H-X9-DG protein
MNIKNKGFTLIELLVVIAIIAMLLAIIMPAMNKAKMYAEEVMCKSNIHQYHIATETYALENKEYYPNPWCSLYKSISFPTEAMRYCRWHNPKMSLSAYPEYDGPYWPYLAVTKANICPTFSKIAPKYGSSHLDPSMGICIGGPFVPQFSYSMNAEFNIDPSNQGQTAKTARRSQVKSPSQTFLWAEENMWTLLGGISTAVLNDTSLMVANGNTDSFGSFHKLSSAQLSIQQSTRIYSAGMVDVLFVDGHAEFIPPKDLKTGENMSVKYKGIIK